jgi:exopolyphosphatase/guanosine-5'-triphosphate,3'-diphosphate pyrophosphatase
VKGYKACATSAMRDAENAQEITKYIKKESDIKIDIISGQKEAEIIYESHFADQLDSGKNYLYVDVGGGSTEISLIIDGKLHESRSFNIGTVRLLNNKVIPGEFERLNDELSVIKNTFRIEEIIGSGGNIIKLHALIKPENGKISLSELNRLYNEMRVFSTDELITKYKLKPDRADVILHAANLYTNIARECGCETFCVPTIGLSDGILHLVYSDWKNPGTFYPN